MTRKESPKLRKAKLRMIEVLSDAGAKQDRWGHFKSEDGNTRIKMQSKSWRLEIKLPSGQWKRTDGDYYTNNTIEVLGLAAALITA